MTVKKTIVGLSAAAALVLGAVQGQAGDIPPASTKKGVTYEKDIQPMFKKHNCFNCHGGDKRPKAKLRVDTLEWLLKGARGGPVATKGKSAESTLVISAARVDEDEAMPPEGKGDALTAAQVGLIRAWIDQGMN
jgi:hypothetical protein